MHAVCSNVCRRKYHGENAHRGHPTITKIKERVAMQRDWEEHISCSIEQETHVEVLARISTKEALEMKKEETRQAKIEGGPVPGNKICKPEEVQGRSLANTKTLKEFEQMD
jgi:hypothetical protein